MKLNILIKAKNYFFVALCVLFYSSNAVAELADGRYGSAQVFDVQRAPPIPAAGVPFTASFFDLPYRDTLPGGQYTIAPGQYVRFIKVSVGNDPVCNYGISLFNADGSLAAVIATGGTVYGLGTQGFLHTSTPGDFGTFVANAAGFALGDSLTYTPTTGAASCVETAAYAASTTPVSTVGPIAAAVVAPSPIPTLSEWALIIMAGLMALFAVRKTSRQ